MLFLFDRQQQPDGSMPRNSLSTANSPRTRSTPSSTSALPDPDGLPDGDDRPDAIRQHVKPAANFVVSHGPSFGPERWEEQSGYSPSTIAAEIAGLLAAANIADVNHDPVSARDWRAVADDYPRTIKGWTVTTNGPLVDHPYFIRLSKTGDPNAAITYNVGNGGPTLDQRSVIDAGFLELARLGELPATDPDILHSLPVVDPTIESNTPSGSAWHRYNGDGYGDGATDGHPWAPCNKGTGHLWPALSSERGEQDLQTGRPATGASLLSAMPEFASGVGLIPEQDWELPDVAPSPYGTDPTTASIGFMNGHPAGSAAPLTWSAGSYVRLAADLGAGRLLDQPRNTVKRYIDHTQGQTQLSVTSPTDDSAINSSPVTVTGTAAPGDTVDVLAINTDHGSSVTPATTTAQHDGSFSVSVAVTPGTTVLSVTATNPVTNATAHTTRTVVWDFVAGTKLLDVADPIGDDNGPGNYAYPTASDFHAGAYDLTDFQVYASPDGSTITFRVQTGDLTPTFGSPLGAQLVDVYVHDPGAAAADTSTAPSFMQRNYVIAAGRRVESPDRGAGLRPAVHRRARDVARDGRDLGERDLALHHVLVPAAALGTPTSGWAFTVALTGQDGFSPDQARAFASDAAAIRVRRLRHRQQRSALHGRPKHGAEGDGRDHASGGIAERRARLHHALAGGHQGCRDSLEVPPTSNAPPPNLSCSLPTLGSVVLQGCPGPQLVVSRVTSAAPSRAIRERGMTRSNPACSAWARTSVSTCE